MLFKVTPNEFEWVEALPLVLAINASLDSSKIEVFTLSEVEWNLFLQYNEYTEWVIFPS